MEKLITIILLFIVCVSCFTNKKMTYEFPNTMNDATKKEFLRQCEKGAILYDINCAKCHTQKTRFGSKIPDFTTDQIYGYEIRLSNSTHENNITAATVSTEELGYILSFLSYKKKSGLVHKSTY